MKGRLRMNRLLRTGALAGLLAMVPAVQQIEAQTSERYQRAERLLGWNASPLVAGADVSANWLSDDNRFWYRVTRQEGHDFMLVDPVQNSQALLFDNGRLAAAMSVAADTTYDPVKLPFTTFDFVEEVREIEFEASERTFRCDIQSYVCSAEEISDEDSDAFVASPDSTWEAFVHEHNLWIRTLGGGDSIQLTTDGEEFWAYGLIAPRAFVQFEGRDDERTPDLRWSPDSRLIAVVRTDERDIPHMPMYSSTSQRPQGYTYPYALPGDSIVPVPHLYIVDVEGRRAQEVAIDPEPAFMSFASVMDSTWTTDSQNVRVLSRTRGHQHEQLVEVDASTAQARVLAVESNETFVDLGNRGPSNWWAGTGGDDVFFFSQRDGWGHLYRYDRDGNLKNQVTSGPWAVGQIQHVDAQRQRVYFTGWGREEGRNPYHLHFYRVNWDGSELTLLTPEDAVHQVQMSPSGRYFVDQHSTINTPPVTVLRNADTGAVVRTLEEADISQVEALGWTPPEWYVKKGRDGVTDIYGILHKPSDFDPEQKYPVVNYTYPGPQIGSVGSWAWGLGTRGNVRALAELGFIVTQIDHMGTPFRSKAFHDKYYGDMADHGLPDHIAVLRALAAERPYMDLDRVGIYGHSGGGFASTAAMLMYPDFFHVAVSTSGNHDNRTYGIHWGEKYQGLLVRDTLRNTDNYESQANQTYAENLKGKLFLMTGDLDDNVHPAMTFQVANELIKANKDFDFLVLPDRAHGLNEPYVIRRTWDYFVTHLRGETPPREFVIRQVED